MGVRPSYFVNETAAIAMVARAMQASASVSSVTLAHATFELFRQTELDTAEDLVDFTFEDEEDLAIYFDFRAKARP